MYERMLDKQKKPTPDQFSEYCGRCKMLYLKADEFLTQVLKADKLMRFPYGNDYGWSFKYFKKGKLICDIFAEKNAFNVMLRLSNAQFEKVCESVSSYTKEYIDNKYPCSGGGWIHYRVLNQENFDDMKTMLTMKVTDK